jgi:regulator of protease activity HflC (stomatin/prohibitin superfamily)
MYRTFPTDSYDGRLGRAGAPGRPVSLLRSITIADGEVGVVFVAGRQTGTLEPGRHRITRRHTSVWPVPVRARLLTLPLQEVPTADGVTVRASLGLVTRITDPEAYVAAGFDADQVAYLTVQVALRELVAGVSYEELLAARSTLADRLLAAIGDLAPLGLVVDRAEVKDLVLPAELRRAQAAVLIARAEGQAALERARGETAALRTLANAARLAADNPALLQLRLVQQLESSSGHTVVLSGPAAPA